MPEADYQLQVTLKSLLDTIVSGLDASLGDWPVYDEAPQDTGGNFIQIGDNSITPRDTKTYNGMEHNPEIHVYSRRDDYEGRAEVKRVMGAIYDGLQGQTAVVSGYQCGIFRFRFSDVFRDPDGIHGVIRFSVETW